MRFYYRRNEVGARLYFTGVCDSVHRGRACFQGACMVVGGQCMVVCKLLGGMHGCWGDMYGFQAVVYGCQGACMVARRVHAWLQGGMHGCQGDMCGCWGCMHGCWGDMHSCQGACMVAGEHVWLPGGMCSCWGFAWLLGGMHSCQGACVVAGGGVHGIQRDMVNEPAVRILLECILVRQTIHA